MPPQRLRLRRKNREHVADVTTDDQIAVDGQAVAVRREADGVVRFTAWPGLAWTAAAGDSRWVFLDGRTYVFTVVTRAGRRASAGRHESLAAPMPASVRQIVVKPGDAVKRGDTVMILEAMKMELPVRAPSDGSVEAVHCREGELVEAGKVLIELADS